ncbi:hypothetical protein [Nocardia wallacei]|uniref:DUF8020 domain-containing protein n=1 Tax=Nocardia wallacei TaxID=480035 RepID=A0A7G1KTH2_9NOCA|nr:hypothetical protein [Nocardia wallacei]BCK57493.1 hypothetical protein NWFMUON74_52650 [Nocardia wallacei]
MRAKRIAATALLAIGATGVTAGVVGAAPAPAAEAGISGVDHGIAYVSAPTADHTGVSTTVTAGRFTLAPDGRAVTLTDVAGREVVTVPLAVRVAGGTVGLTPRIDPAGRTLTLTADSAAAQVAQHIDEAETQARKQHNAVVGALIGAGIGAVIGFFLGGVGALVTVPIGAGIGALIGYSTP